MGLDDIWEGKDISETDQEINLRNVYSLDEVVVTRQKQETRVQIDVSFFRNRGRFRLFQADTDSNFYFDSFVSYLLVLDREVNLEFGESFRHIDER